MQAVFSDEGHKFEVMGDRVPDCGDGTGRKVEMPAVRFREGQPRVIEHRPRVRSEVHGAGQDESLRS